LLSILEARLLTIEEVLLLVVAVWVIVVVLGLGVEHFGFIFLGFFICVISIIFDIKIYFLVFLLGILVKLGVFIL
jgi:hypothetical protein